MTLYRLRTVVLDCSGKTAVVLETCDLTASTIEQAKAEAERHSCHPNALSSSDDGAFLSSHRAVYF